MVNLCVRDFHNGELDEFVQQYSENYYAYRKIRTEANVQEIL